MKSNKITSRNHKEHLDNKILTQETQTNEIRDEKFDVSKSQTATKIEKHKFIRITRNISNFTANQTSKQSAHFDEHLDGNLNRIEPRLRKTQTNTQIYPNKRRISPSTTVEVSQEIIVKKNFVFSFCFGIKVRITLSSRDEETHPSQREHGWDCVCRTRCTLHLLFSCESTCPSGYRNKTMTGRLIVTLIRPKKNEKMTRFLHI